MFTEHFLTQHVSESSYFMPYVEFDFELILTGFVVLVVFSQLGCVEVETILMPYLYQFLTN